MTYNYIIIGLEPDQQRPNQFKQIMAPCQDLDVLYQFIARMTKFEVFTLTPCEETEEQWRAAVAAKVEEQERELLAQLKAKYEQQPLVGQAVCDSAISSEHCDGDTNPCSQGPVPEADIQTGLRSV